MPSFVQLVSLLREQMHATLSRSDVLKPLAWLVGMLLIGTVLLLFAKAPEWLVISVSVALLCSIALYGLAYIFCLFADRDALRSERYSLHKMAIEHGLVGDSAAGMFDPEQIAARTPQIEKKP